MFRILNTHVLTAKVTNNYFNYYTSVNFAIEQRFFNFSSSNFFLSYKNGQATALFIMIRAKT